jgi:hypothetical protein
MNVHQALFVPFANEADVIQIGNLTVENRLDRVTFDGDVDLTLDQAGLIKARLLHQILAGIVAKLEAGPLPETLPPPEVKTVDNPFN